MDEVECAGSEKRLLDCGHKTVEDCSGWEGAGVVCTGPSPVGKNKMNSHISMIRTILCWLVPSNLCQFVPKPQLFGETKDFGGTGKDSLVRQMEP